MRVPWLVKLENTTNFCLRNPKQKRFRLIFSRVVEDQQLLRLGRPTCIHRVASTVHVRWTILRKTKREANVFLRLQSIQSTQDHTKILPFNCIFILKNQHGCASCCLLQYHARTKIVEGQSCNGPCRTSHQDAIPWHSSFSRSHSQPCASNRT